MIYIVTAMYCEAQSLIAYFHLKKDTAHTRFQVFWKEEAGIRLIITGTGEIAAAAAVSSICTEYGVGPGDFLVNIGVCAGSEDGMFLCSKITEESTGKTFYPDMLYRHVSMPFGREKVIPSGDTLMPFCREVETPSRDTLMPFGKEMVIVTGMQPLLFGGCVSQYGTGGCGAASQERLRLQDTLYDMESAAIYQAGSYFFGPHQMSFIKIVSDRGTAASVTQEQVARLFEDKIEEIALYLRQLQKIASDQTEQASIFGEDFTAWTEKLCQDMHCSQVMKASLLQHIRYLALSGVDYAAAAKEMYREQKLPCRDKREGKIRLEEWKRIIQKPSPRISRSRLANRRKPYYHSFFSHIYVEKSVRDHPRTKRIIEQFPNAHVIEIDHYKDVFCRRGQNYLLQHQAQNLILAQKTGNLIYPGAPVCQSFGNEHFYYTSCMMNCIYDCEYCYLKGMYPSGNIVVFVNLEDYFEKIREILARHAVYLCVSYDTDLLALERICGYVGEWLLFAKTQEHLKLEIRTKFAEQAFFESMEENRRIIYAFTISPQQVIDAYEHGTPSLEKRIDCAAFAAQRGHPVRLCFDPLIYCPEWKEQYDHMLQLVFSRMQEKDILDVSVGTFRISQEYLKNMRKQAPDLAVVQFPYINHGGVYQYPAELAEEMEQYLMKELRKMISEEKIFLWEKQQS